MALEKVGLQAVIEGMGPFQSAARQIDQTYDKLSTSSTKAGGVLSRLGGIASTAIGFAVGTVAVQAIGKFTSEIGGMITAGMAIEQTEATFAKLVGTVGGTLPTAMDKLRKATRGMVSDQDLMLAGNKFLAMGLAETEDEAAKLSEMATQLGSAMGEDATASMENFALMLANQSIPRLDSFGISSGKVRERILELMQADKALTREQAFMAAVMEQGAVTMEKVGEQSGSTAATMARFRAQVQNLKTGIGRALIPIMSALLKVIIPIVQVVGDRLLPVFQRFGQWVGEAITIFREFIDALMIGGEMGDFLEDVIGKRMTAAILPLIDVFQRARKGFVRFAKIYKKYVALLVKSFKLFGKTIVPLFQWIGKRLIPIVRKFGDTLRELVSKVDEWLKPFRDAIEGIGEAFEWLRAGDIEAFLERLWVALDAAFGSRLADAVYQFADMITGVFHAFQFLRAGDFPAFLDRLRYALANVFGRDMAARFTAFIGQAREVARDMVTHFAVPIEEAFRRAKAVAIDWWKGIDGGRAILEDAKKGWGTILDTIVSLTNEFSSSLQQSLQPVLSWITEALAPMSELLDPLAERLGELGDALAKQLPEGGLVDALGRLDELLPKISEKLEPIIAEVQEHSDKIRTVFGVLGAGILTAVLTKILGPVGLIAGAVRIAKQAWDENWFGMRDTIKDVIDREILPRLEKLRVNLKSGGIDIEGMLIRLRERFAELKPMGRDVWGAMQIAWERFWVNFQRAAKPFTDYIAKWASEQFLPRLPKLFDAVSKFGETLAETLAKMTKEISAFLKRHPGIKQMLQKMIDLIVILASSAVMGTLDMVLNSIILLVDAFIWGLNIASWTLENIVQPAVTLVIASFDTMINTINLLIGAFQALWDRAAQVWAYLKGLWEWFQGIQIPGLGLLGVGAAKQEISGRSPTVQGADIFSGFGAGWRSPVTVPAVAGPTTYDYRRYETGKSPITLYANYTEVQGEASIAEDFETLSILHRIG